MVEDYPVPRWRFSPGAGDCDRRAFLRDEFADPCPARKAQKYLDSRFAIHAYTFTYVSYLSFVHVVVVLPETPQDLILYSGSELAVDDSVDRGSPPKKQSGPRARTTRTV